MKLVQLLSFQSSPLLVSGDYQLAAIFFESFLNFEKSFCSWPSEMNNCNKILKDMDLIYFSRMKMKGESFFLAWQYRCLLSSNFNAEAVSVH